MAANEITIDLTVEKNRRRNWVEVVTHRAARALGVKLLPRVFDIPQQDCADPSRTVVVLEDSTGAARATYCLRVGSEYPELTISKVALMTAQEAQTEIGRWC